jgi:hypothetical protein
MAGLDSTINECRCPTPVRLMGGWQKTSAAAPMRIHARLRLHQRAPSRLDHVLGPTGPLPVLVNRKQQNTVRLCSTSHCRQVNDPHIPLKGHEAGRDTNDACVRRKEPTTETPLERQHSRDAQRVCVFASFNASGKIAVPQPTHRSSHCSKHKHSDINIKGSVFCEGA